MYLPRTPLFPLASYFGRRRFLLYRGILAFLEDNPGSTLLVVSLALGLHETTGMRRFTQALGHMTHEGVLRRDDLPGGPIYTLTPAGNNWLQTLKEYPEA